ncbi:MAG: Nif3-like dinuclear metal center hexameric protein [Bacteroidetes bacterium]|nr:Nif3-like dinuclear metal center hexameric protein [Bacteroidota bacterium]
MSRVIGDIEKFVHEWAPKGSAQSYDNVGLQIGRLDRPVTKVLIALDLTPLIIQEARELGAELIITHHPLLFKPLKSLTGSSLVSSMALEMAESGMALLSAHTNLDCARDGVSFELARTLGLSDVEFLSGLEETLFKLVVFVPPERAEAVRSAAHEAGAGQIGKYSYCSFSAGGTGQFKPGSFAQPFIGEAEGPIEKVSEVRIEMQVEKWRVEAVLEAVKRAHPYEEVAYDLIPLSQKSENVGLGAIGWLPKPLVLDDFLNLTSARLNNPALRFAGHPSQMIHRVAVCGGSGSEFIPLALRAGADAYVTGDISYHPYFDVLGTDGQAKMALVDVGHYESEQMTEDLLVARLSAKFPDISWNKTRLRSSPVETWVRRST